MKKLITVIFIALLSISAFSQHDITESRHICLEAYVYDDYYLTKCNMYINEMYFTTEVPSIIKFSE